MDLFIIFDGDSKESVTALTGVLFNFDCELDGFGEVMLFSSFAVLVDF